MSLAADLMTVTTAAALAIWLYLWLGHAGFWRAKERLDAASGPESGHLPAVVAIVPARNEAAVIGEALAGLLSQDYAGPLTVIVVDDASSDGTADVARGAAHNDTGKHSLTVVTAAPRPAGWVGKVWAMHQGLTRAASVAPGARYVLFTDADVAHGPDVLSRLVRKAEDDGLDLVSLMVRLSRAGPWEALLIPTFVLFFQKLYPFRRVNDPARRTAAAAGGTMLLRAAALERIGGMAAIRGALIDDCALARAIKPGGPIWLGLGDASRSIRPYGGLGGVWRMVARSAFDQLGYSTAALAGTLAGMVLLYIVPPLAVMDFALGGEAAVGLLGAAGWAVMIRCALPMLRYYAVPAPLAAAVPLAGVLYAAMTLDSARRHWMGKGGEWKMRHHRPGRGAIQ